uniref:Uncharacterized protein n=1 Tax=Plectus sambesii TaxID=2011161 RepID=A0A914UZD6_9BILA
MVKNNSAVSLHCQLLSARAVRQAQENAENERRAAMGDYGGVPVSIIRRESLQTESLRRGSDFSGSVPESVLRREWMLAGQRRGSDFSGSVPESIIRRESISLRPETELSPMYEGDRTSESTVTADTAYPQRFVHLVPEEAHGLLRKESYQKSQASPNADNASVIMQKNRQISPPELRQPNRFDRTALSTTTTTTPTSLVERIRHSALQTAQQIRSRIINSGWKCTPRLLAHFAVILILSALFFTIFGVLMKQTEVRYSLHEFILYPRLQTREGHPLNYVPSKLYMKFGTNQQA